MNERLVLVHTVDHDRSTAADVVDGLLREFLDPSRLDHNVEPERVVLLELLPLRARVLSVELDVLVSCVELLRDVHLDALVRRDHDAVCAVLLQQLGKDKPCWACAKKEDVDADWWTELIKPVDGTCSGFKERGFFIGEIVDFVTLLLVTICGGQN